MKDKNQKLRAQLESAPTTSVGTNTNVSVAKTKIIDDQISSTKDVKKSSLPYLGGSTKRYKKEKFLLF